MLIGLPWIFACASARFWSSLCAPWFVSGTLLTPLPVFHLFACLPLPNLSISLSTCSSDCFCFHFSFPMDGLFRSDLGCTLLCPWFLLSFLHICPHPTLTPTELNFTLWLPICSAVYNLVLAAGTCSSNATICHGGCLSCSQINGWCKISFLLVVSTPTKPLSLYSTI